MNKAQKITKIKNLVKLIEAKTGKKVKFEETVKNKNLTLKEDSASNNYGIPDVEVAYVSADWKDIEGLAESFKNALFQFGINCYEDPNFEGSDMFGFILSRETLSNEELEELARSANED